MHVQCQGGKIVKYKIWENKSSSLQQHHPPEYRVAQYTGTNLASALSLGCSHQTCTHSNHNIPLTALVLQSYTSSTASPPTMTHCPPPRSHHFPRHSLVMSAAWSRLWVTWLWLHSVLQIYVLFSPQPVFKLCRSSSEYIGPLMAQCPPPPSFSTSLPPRPFTSQSSLLPNGMPLP